MKHLDEYRAPLLARRPLRERHHTAYGTRRTPRHPLGAPMVSAEGTRSAFRPRCAPCPRAAEP
ncbi:hypothetical protein ACFYZH_11590 [Streptomyces abikoensis]|uniref:hypothetical protein n=1 Tax=Streptomyces abikoensis TaxID=97398 RepID=UPI0036AD5A8F